MLRFEITRCRRRAVRLPSPTFAVAKQRRVGHLWPLPAAPRTASVDSRKSCTRCSHACDTGPSHSSLQHASMQSSVSPFAGVAWVSVFSGGLITTPGSMQLPCIHLGRHDVLPTIHRCSSSPPDRCAVPSILQARTSPSFSAGRGHSHAASTCQSCKLYLPPFGPDARLPERLPHEAPKDPDLVEYANQSTPIQPIWD